VFYFGSMARRFSFVEPVAEAPAPVQGPNANSFPSLSSTVRLFLVTGQVVEKAWWDTTIHKFYGFGDSAWSCTPSDVLRWEYTRPICPGPHYASILGTPLGLHSRELSVAKEQENARWFNFLREREATVMRERVPTQ